MTATSCVRCRRIWYQCQCQCPSKKTQRSNPLVEPNHSQCVAQDPFEGTKDPFGGNPDQQSSMWTPALILEAGMQPFIAPHEDSDEGVAEAVAVGLDMLCDEVTSRGSLVDRERGIAVIRLDPELAAELRWGADHLAPSEVTMTPPPRGSLRWTAALMDRAARIIGGEGE